MPKKGNGFSNKAARKFDEPNKVDLYSESEIYEVLNEDVDEILSQLTANRERRGRFPKYTSNMFANISTAKYFYEYVKENWKDLSDDEKLSMKSLISQAFKDSVSMKYQNQAMENGDRNDYLRETFYAMSKKAYKVAKKLGLEKDKTKDLIIQAYIEPKYAIKQVAKLFDMSTLSDKKKMKLLKNIYGGKERFVDAVGASLTVDFNSSDFVHMVYGFVMKLKKDKRKKFIEAYAINFKKIKKSSFVLKGDFLEKNAKVIKRLIRKDRGYKKAFDIGASKASKNGKKDKKEKKKGSVEKDFNELNSLFKRADRD